MDVSTHRGAALRLSRSRPLAAAIGVLAASALDPRLFVAALFLSYLAGRGRPLGGTALGGFAGALAFGIAVQLVQRVDLYTWLVWVGGTIAFGLFPALVGSFRRLQAELVRTGWDRAAQLEREQRAVAEQARLRERTRIARDMHDSLGHELSLVALRAGALELAGGLAPADRAAAAELRAGVTTAAQRLGEIVGLLDDETDERIEDLVARAAGAGMPVVLRRGGEYADVAPMQYRTAYRVVQESLTNAARHAGAAATCVRLDRDAGDILVTVSNEPPREVGDPPSRGGRGLAGLRGSVTAAGGVLHAAPTPDGGFEVAARLPVRPGTAAPSIAAAGATGFRRARNRARRGLALVVALPLALGIALTGTLMVVYAHDSFTSRLPPDRFVDLAVGQSRDDVAGRLPRRQVPEHRDEAGPPAPVGSTCEYYRSAAGFVPTPFDVYRLCFRDGHLVAKDVLAPQATP